MNYDDRKPSAHRREDPCVGMMSFDPDTSTRRVPVLERAHSSFVRRENARKVHDTGHAFREKMSENVSSGKRIITTEKVQTKKGFSYTFFVIV